MQFRLRTLLIVLALAPLMLAVAWWVFTVEEAASLLSVVIVIVIVVWIGARFVHYSTRNW